MTEVPRRYGVDHTDYDPAVGACLAVSLDGKPVDHVIEYDIDAGQVTRFQTDAQGLFVIDDEEVKTEVLHGDVQVTRVQDRGHQP